MRDLKNGNKPSACSMRNRLDHGCKFICCGTKHKIKMHIFEYTFCEWRTYYEAFSLVNANVNNGARLATFVTVSATMSSHAAQFGFADCTYIEVEVKVMA